ncbi:MAG: hypothetical protein R2909_11770, partial [Gemmatimonadales bacterium]
FDLGSGLLADLTPFGLRGEPLVAEAARHADLVIFSGDKLLGGPQAGIVAGRGELLARLRKNPYARALRADKLTLAALQATLALYRDEPRARREIPVLRMLTETAEELAARAERLAGLVRPSFHPATRAGASAVGGGAFPDAELPTTLVTLDPGELGAHALALKLRLANPSVLARVEGGLVVLDPRTVAPDQLPDLAAAIIQASL